MKYTSILWGGLTSIILMMGCNASKLVSESSQSVSDNASSIRPFEKSLLDSCQDSKTSITESDGQKEDFFRFSKFDTTNGVMRRKSLIEIQGNSSDEHYTLYRLEIGNFQELDSGHLLLSTVDSLIEVEYESGSMLPTKYTEYTNSGIENIDIQLNYNNLSPSQYHKIMQAEGFIQKYGR